MASQDYLNQMNELINQYSGMAPATQDQINQDVMAKVNNLQPQYQELRGAEAAAYAAPTELMQQYNQQYGEAPGAGPSALSRLNTILNTIGQQYGTTNAMRDALKQSQGTLGQIGSNIYNQYGAQRQGVLDRYDMLSPLYQQELAKEQAAAQLQQQRDAQAASNWQFQQQLDAMDRIYSPTPTPNTAIPEELGGSDIMADAGGALNFLSGINTGSLQGPNYGLKSMAIPTSQPFTTEVKTNLGTLDPKMLSNSNALLKKYGL